MVSYKKLWKMLIDRDMKKKDLARIADLSTYTIQKNEPKRKCQYRDFNKDL